MKVVGGKPFYGEAIGILMLDNRKYPKIPGDVGNACSYDFPVRIDVVPNLNMNPFPPIHDKDGKLTSEVQMVVDAARDMEAKGVRAIALCCGFFSLIQEVVADAVDIPLFSSPLVMIPSIFSMLGKDKGICVLTASKKFLSSEFLAAVGVTEEMPVFVTGMDGSEEYNATHLGGKSIVMDVDKVRDDVVTAVQEVVESNTSIGAVVIECTNLPPFAVDIQQATGLPVFDQIAFIDMIYRAVAPKRYQGIL